MCFWNPAGAQVIRIDYCSQPRLLIQRKPRKSSLFYFGKGLHTLKTCVCMFLLRQELAWQTFAGDDKTPRRDFKSCLSQFTAMSFEAFALRPSALRPTQLAPPSRPHCAGPPHGRSAGSALCGGCAAALGSAAVAAVQRPRRMAQRAEGRPVSVTVELTNRHELPGWWTNTGQFYWFPARSIGDLVFCFALIS